MLPMNLRDRQREQACSNVFSNLDKFAPSFLPVVLKWSNLKQRFAGGSSIANFSNR